MKTVELRSLQLLRSSIATLIVLALALVAQSNHAAYVFMAIPHNGDPVLFSWFERVHGNLFAAALELAVLLFVVRGRTYESYTFAIVSVLMNLAYYHLHGISLFSVQALPAWLVSGSLPAAIALYSHSVADVQPLADSTSVAVSDSNPAHVVVNNQITVASSASSTQLATTSSDSSEDATTSTILQAIASGAVSAYAISKRTGIALTTLQRKQGDSYTGRLIALVASGVLSNSSGKYQVVEDQA